MWLLKGVRQLICPYCTQENELTWKRYFKEPRGRHTCQSCNNRFRFKRPLWYFALIPILAIVSVVLSIAIAYAVTGKLDDKFLAVYFVFVTAIIMPIDRKIENCWLITIPINKQGKLNSK